MSTLDRTSDKPIVCRYDDTIKAEHAGRHFPVFLATDGETGAYDHPKVSLQGSAAENARVWAELGSVDPDTETCQVYRRGLMYFRSKAAYDDANDGSPVSYSDTANQVKVIDFSSPTVALLQGAIDAPIQEGGFKITETGSDGAETEINILKCRR